MLWRWLESRPEECRSDRNLLIDQAIFEAHREGVVEPTIRLYTWDVPVVSLGRLQSEDRARREFPDRQFVRRTTGGLAVEHGGDLTISIVANESLLRKEGVNRPDGVLASYFCLLSGIVSAFREIGIDAAFGSEIETCPLTSNCFEHIGRCDVVDAATGRKILGSAQRRAEGCILQQMSIPPHDALEVHSRELKSLLRRHYQVSLGITMWQNETEITTIETQRLREHLSGHAEELEDGSKNSYLRR